MSLIADALKRAQEQRTAGKGGKDAEDRARRMLTGSGPLRVGTGSARGVPRSVGIAGTVLAAAMITFGGVVWLSPRAEPGPAPATPSNPVGPRRTAANPAESQPAASASRDGIPAGEAGSEVVTEAIPGVAGLTAEGTRPGAAEGGMDEPPVDVGETALAPAGQAGEASSFTLRIEGQAAPSPASASELFGRALGAQQAGDLQGAAQLYRRAIAQNPTDAQLHNNLGTVYRALNMPGEALTAFRRAVEVDPGYAPAWSNLGIMLDGLGRDDEAIDAFREALRHDPSNTGARVNLANKYIGMGLLDEARSLLGDVLRDEPALPEAHYALARALEEAGETDEAARHYRVFLQLAAGRFPGLEERVRGHLADLEGGGG